MNESGVIRDRKKNKFRATLLVVCSLAGEKLLPLYIDTAKKPRWTQVMGRKAVAPIDYTHSAKGWMTQNIFGQVCTMLEQKREPKRTALLTADNCSVHCGMTDRFRGVNKTSLCVLMSPKNVTSKVQPCDQGVIRSLKASYHEKLIARLLLTYDTRKVSLYEGLMMVRVSWSNVR